MDDEQLIAIQFLQRYLADRDQGCEATLAAYRALFRGHEAIVDREYAAINAASTYGASSLGRFRLVRELGRGGQARVWLAHDSALEQRLVALKVIPLAKLGGVTAAIRFRRELRIASQLDLPGVCPIHDAGEDGEVAWIAMRYVPGRTLRDWIADRGRDAQRGEIDEILRIVEELSRTVHSVHLRSVVHRDLKPANVMLADDGHPIVLDFGIARWRDAEDGLTRSGDEIGTPAYMAPEQVRGELDRVGPATDVWGLGGILYEMLAGRRAFSGPTSELVARAVLDASPADLRHVAVAVSRDLATVVETALHKDISRRYSTAEALADELARLRRGDPVLARPITRIARMGRWLARRPALAAALVALVMVLGVGLAAVIAMNENLRLESMARERAVRFVEALSDAARLEQLGKQIEQGLPLRAASHDGLRLWLGAADELLARRPQHEQFLLQLRRSAMPVTRDAAVDAETRQQREHEIAYFERRTAAIAAELETARNRGDVEAAKHLAEALEAGRAMLLSRRDQLEQRSVFRFVSKDLQWMHDRVEATLLSLDGFAELRPGRSTALLGRLRLRAADRIAAANRVNEPAWRNVQARLAGPGSPYAAVTLTPQDGLVPLGPDPASGLEEFAMLESGEVPVRDRAGKLEITSDSGVVLVLLPGGVVPIGLDAESQQEGTRIPAAASPRHLVELAPFFVGKYEVTRGQFERVVFRKPSNWSATTPFAAGETPTDLHPVDVDWGEAQRFAHALGLDLPTESQWEYSCRAGTTTAWSCGDDSGSLSAFGNLADRSYAALDADARLEVDLDDRFAGPAPIGRFMPNGFALHDLLGNLREWCADFPGTYAVPAFGPTGRHAAGWLSTRAVRGGSFRTRAAQACSAWRDDAPPEQHRDDIGFRVVRTIDPESG